MTPKIKDFAIPVGNDIEIPLRFKYRAGTAYDLTGCKLLFVVKANQNDNEPLFKLSTDTGEITVHDGNFAKISIDRELTRGQKLSTAEYSLHLITKDNKFKTLLQGEIDFEPIVE